MNATTIQATRPLHPTALEEDLLDIFEAQRDSLEEAPFAVPPSVTRRQWQG